MRTNKSKQTEQPKQRVLKINTRFRINTYRTKLIPELKLCGNWLMSAGFERGTYVVVTFSKNKLIIQKQ